MNGGLMKAAGHGAIAVVAGLLMCTTSATAADLGGNCCADLEERVAELEATTARKGNRRVSLIISGQVNTAVMSWDNGAVSTANKSSSDIYIVDNGVSRSGFNFDGSAKINPNLTAGFQVVVGLASGARSHQTNEFQSGDAAGAGGDDATGNGVVESVIVFELANWYLTHSQLGRLSVGRLNGASAGSTIVDLGGAGVIANANIGLWQRAFTMVNGTGAYTTGSVTTWSAFLGGGAVNVSGLNRSNAIRYDTPTMHGFSLAAAWGEDDMWDAALRYAGEWSGFRMAAAVAYTHNVSGVNDTNDAAPNGLPGTLLANGTDTNRWQGSASILHVATGLFLSGSYVNESHNGNATFELIEGSAVNRADTTLWYLQGGITRNWTGMGNTVFYGEYANVQDGAAGFIVNGELLESSEATMWGLGVVQHIDAAAMELYLSYRQYSAEAVEVVGGTQSFEDFGVVMGGARIRF